MSHPGSQELKNASGRGGRGWLSGQEGAVSAEYIVLFVIICIAALGLFTTLGKSLYETIN